jgi:arylsulfatase
VFHYNHCGVERYEAAGKEALAPGRHTLAFEFDYAGGGVGKAGKGVLSVDGTQVAKVDFPRTIGYRMSLDETFDVGEDTGTPVSEAYAVPFAFSGTLRKLVIELEGVAGAEPVEAGTGR